MGYRQHERMPHHASSGSGLNKSQIRRAKVRVPRSTLLIPAMVPPLGHKMGLVFSAAPLLEFLVPHMRVKGAQHGTVLETNRVVPSDRDKKSD